MLLNQKPYEIGAYEDAKSHLANIQQQQQQQQHHQTQQQQQQLFGSTKKLNEKPPCDTQAQLNGKANKHGKLSGNNIYNYNHNNQHHNQPPQSQSHLTTSQYYSKNVKTNKQHNNKFDEHGKSNASTCSSGGGGTKDMSRSFSLNDLIETPSSNADMLSSGASVDTNEHLLVGKYDINPGSVAQSAVNQGNSGKMVSSIRPNLIKTKTVNKSSPILNTSNESTAVNTSGSVTNCISEDAPSKLPTNFIPIFRSPPPLHATLFSSIIELST